MIAKSNYTPYTVLCTVKIMNIKEQELLKLAIEYKKEYENTSWWKFRKINKAYNNWQRTLELIVKQ